MIKIFIYSWKYIQKTLVNRSSDIITVLHSWMGDNTVFYIGVLSAGYMKNAQRNQTL